MLVIISFALASLALWVAIGVFSLVVLRRRGGAVPVDNERNINPRYFSQVLRELLRQALAKDWGQETEGNWRFGHIVMNRRRETIGVYHGDLAIERPPRRMAAMVVTGTLNIADNAIIDCDLWCLGRAAVGKRCRLRSLAADKAIEVGEKTIITRWLDAETVLFLGPEVNVVAMVSAGQEMILGHGFSGGKIAAPVVRTGLVGDEISRRRIAETARHWLAMRSDRPGGEDLVDETAHQWMQPDSAYTSGQLWIGPRSLVLHDLVSRGPLQIGADSVVAGSIHSDRELRIMRGALITGNVSCAHLILEEHAVVLGSAHVAGNAVLLEGSVIGLQPGMGGLAALGTVQLKGGVSVVAAVTAGDRISLG